MNPFFVGEIHSQSDWSTIFVVISTTCPYSTGLQIWVHFYGNLGPILECLIWAKTKQHQASVDDLFRKCGSADSLCLEVRNLTNNKNEKGAIMRKKRYEYHEQQHHSASTGCRSSHSQAEPGRGTWLRGYSNCVSVWRSSPWHRPCCWMLKGVNLKNIKGGIKRRQSQRKHGRKENHPQIALFQVNYSDLTRSTMISHIYHIHDMPRFQITKS